MSVIPLLVFVENEGQEGNSSPISKEEDTNEQTRGGLVTPNHAIQPMKVV